MNVTRFIFNALSLCSFLVLSAISLYAGSTTDEIIREKQERIAMRMIGNDILHCLGDFDSRVLPIERTDEYFRISFEFEFELDPDDLVSITDHVMTDTELSSHYIVEVVKCNSSEVVHSFQIDKGYDQNIIACKGRILPKDCYNILVTILDGKPIDGVENLSVGEEPSPFKAALLIVPLILLIGYTGITAWTREPEEDPHIIKIGDTSFDQKNMTLSHNNKTIELSHKEALLLTALNDSVNQPLKREDILHKVWGDEGDYIGRTLDVFISKLRKKLVNDETVRIVNVRGVGYKLLTN